MPSSTSPTLWSWKIRTSWTKFPPTALLQLLSRDINRNSNETSCILRRPKLTLTLLTRWSRSRRLRLGSSPRKVVTRQIPEIGNAVAGVVGGGVAAGVANVCPNRSLPGQPGKRNGSRRRGRSDQIVQNVMTDRNGTTVPNEASAPISDRRPV